MYFYVATLIVSGLLVACFLGWKIYDCNTTSAKARYTDIAVSDDEENEIELGTQGDDEAENEENEDEEEEVNGKVEEEKVETES